MKIEYIPIDDLKPYEGNARVHEERSVDAIKNSILEFGFEDPLEIWGDDNIIVAGHGRYEAAFQLGIEKLPCIRLDHLTDEERRAYTIASNSVAELSGWKFDVLEEELEALGSFDMSKYGFDDYKESEYDIDSFLQDTEKEKQKKMIQCTECGEWFEI